MSDECLSNKNVDVVVIGEGEETLSELYEAIKKKQKFDSIKGIAYKKNGKIIYNPPQQLIEDINKIPPFPYDLFEKDFDKYRDFGTIITSRGYPFQCIYCSQRCISSNRYRYLSTERVLEEIGLLLDKYKQKKIWFNGDNFAVNKKRLMELLDAIIERDYKKNRIHCRTKG